MLRIISWEVNSYILNEHCSFPSREMETVKKNIRWITKKILNWKASQNQTIVFYLNTGINDITMITQCIKTSVI